MFTEDELHQARAVPVLEIAERHGAKLKRSGKQYEGACPHCGGDDRFWVVPEPQCRRLPRMRLSRRRHRARDASERPLVHRRGEGADRQGRRNADATPTDARGNQRARSARSGTAPGRGRRAGAQRKQRGEDRRPPAAGRWHAGRSLPARRPQHRREPLGDQAGAGGRRDARLVRADLLPSGRPEQAPATNSTANGSARSSRS